MSDTPETDFTYENAIISAATGDFLPIATAMLKQAKKLERERDEAREELEIARLQRDEAVVDHQRVFKERETARGEADRYFKERNKAQEEAELLRAVLVACESWITDGGYAESDSGQVAYEKTHKVLESPPIYKMTGGIGSVEK